MKNVIVYLLIFSSSISQASSIIEREKKIQLLLEKEIRLVEKAQNPGLNLKRRLLELYSERMAIIKKIEDQEFLEQKKGKVEKAIYFTKTTQEYNRIQKFGLDVIKDYPTSQNLADIYYTLALNSRDFATDNKTENYLMKSLILAKNKSLQYNIRSAMADFYYNEKKYNQAIEHYEWIISQFDDEWKSKNLYNLSWCYLKVENFKRGLELQLESYHRSTIPGSIDMREQAINTLPTFFVLADRSRDGLTFFLERNQETAEAIIKMAKRASENGEYGQALYLLNQTQDFLIKQANLSELLKIKNYFLTFYKQYHRYEDHLKTAIEIAELSGKTNIADSLKEEIISQLKAHAGYLQIRLEKNVAGQSAGLSSINTLEHVVQYFDILINLNPKETDEYAYFQGESYLTEKRFKASYQSYKKGIEFIDHHKKDSTFTKKTFNSLLAIIERNWASNDFASELTEFTFINYIKLLPLDELTAKIFPRLYSYYIDLAKFDAAETTLMRFIQQYPTYQSEQKQLATHLVDKYIKLENASAISNWINLMNQSFLGFNKDEKVKTEIILGQILFKKAGELEAAGRSEEALESYLSLYKVEYYPRNIRANAALKKAVLFARNNKPENSSKWTRMALEMFETDELKKQKLTIAGLADYHLLKQYLESAQEISSLIVKTYCQFDNKLAQDYFLKVASLHQQLNQYSDLKQHLKSNQCPIAKEILAQEVNNLFIHWLQTGKDKHLKNFHQEFAALNPKINKLYLNFIKQKLWQSVQAKQSSNIQNLIKEMQLISTNDLSDKEDQKEINLIVTSLRNLEVLSNIPLENFNFLKDQKEFNEDFMMGRLNQSVENLNKIKASVDELINCKIAEIVNFSSAKLTELYSQQAHHYKAIRINHPDIDYLKSFYDQMGQLSDSTKETALKYQITNLEFIQKNKLLSASNQSLFKHDNDHSLLERISFKPYLVSVDKK
jgi:hypothetical protein